MYIYFHNTGKTSLNIELDCFYTRANMCVLRLHKQKPFNIMCKGVCLYITARNANDQNNLKSTNSDKYLNTINNRVVKTAYIIGVVVHKIVCLFCFKFKFNLNKSSIFYV